MFVTSWKLDKNRGHNILNCCILNNGINNGNNGIVVFFLQVFYQYFEFYTSLYCVLELTEMSIKLMDYRKMPVLVFVLLLLLYGLFFLQ